MGKIKVLLLIRIKMIKKLSKLLIFSLLFSKGCFVLGEQKSDLCDNDWVDATFFGLGCLFTNHTWAGGMTQDEAYTFCYKLDSRARLLEIHNENDMLFIDVLIDQENGVGSRFWLGGSDRGHEGTWYWESSREPVEDFIWDENYPAQSIEYNCMAWYYSVESVHDYPCDSSYYPLCQIPI